MQRGDELSAGLSRIEPHSVARAIFEKPSATVWNPRVTILGLPTIPTRLEDEFDRETGYYGVHAAVRGWLPLLDPQMPENVTIIFRNGEKELHRTVIDTSKRP